ncbi:hypothetical protein [Ornithinimicrobium sp. CNJ-824]|uniref:hypothetical protein n=1 Tax=Ornithinimicrobium sp. CNJ-824 TaxID=1904966 RepID=UPI001EDA4C52|nr:hypothetical protein [Ornithinimicrobium sp. CNJ-824]
MLSLWRTVRDLLAVLPPGTRRFIITFAGLQSLLATLDVAAIGLLALVLAPMLTGATLTVPVIGLEISTPEQFRTVLIMVGVLIIAKSVLAVALQWWATRRFARFEQNLGARLLESTFAAPWTERLQRNSTDLVRSTDVGVASTVSGVLIPFCQLSGELFTFLAVLTVLLVAQPLLAGATIVYFFLVGLLLYKVVLRRAVQAGRDNRDASTRAVRLVSEMVHSLKEITLRDKQERWPRWCWRSAGARPRPGPTRPSWGPSRATSSRPRSSAGWGSGPRSATCRVVLQARWRRSRCSGWPASGSCPA